MTPEGGVLSIPQHPRACGLAWGLLGKEVEEQTSSGELVKKSYLVVLQAVPQDGEHTVWVVMERLRQKKPKGWSFLELSGEGCFYPSTAPYAYGPLATFVYARRSHPTPGLRRATPQQRMIPGSQLAATTSSALPTGPSKLAAIFTQRHSCTYEMVFPYIAKTDGDIAWDSVMYAACGYGATPIQPGALPTDLLSELDKVASVVMPATKDAALASEIGIPRVDI